MFQQLAAAGATPWMAPQRILAFGLGLGLTFSVDANMTVTVQHTFDTPQTARTVSITRVGTTATINDPLHGLNTGDNIIISASDTTFGGSWDITIVDLNNYTITVPNSGATSSTPTLQSFRVFPNDNANLVNVSGTPPPKADGNYAYPIAAVRLKATAYTAGQAELTMLQAFGGGQ
jgi:hypothetical protein